MFCVSISAHDQILWCRSWAENKHCICSYSVLIVSIWQHFGIFHLFSDSCHVLNLVEQEKHVSVLNYKSGVNTWQWRWNTGFHMTFPVWPFYLKPSLLVMSKLLRQLLITSHQICLQVFVSMDCVQSFLRFSSYESLQKMCPHRCLKMTDVSKPRGVGSPFDVGSFLGHFDLKLHPLAHHGVNVIQQLGDGDWRLWRNKRGKHQKYWVIKWTESFTVRCTNHPSNTELEQEWRKIDGG